MTREELGKAADAARGRMESAAAKLDFVAAARYRDEMRALKNLYELRK